MAIFSSLRFWKGLLAGLQAALAVCLWRDASVATSWRWRAAVERFILFACLLDGVWRACVAFSRQC